MCNHPCIFSGCSASRGSICQAARRAGPSVMQRVARSICQAARRAGPSAMQRVARSICQAECNAGPSVMQRLALVHLSVSIQVQQWLTRFYFAFLSVPYIFANSKKYKDGYNRLVVLPIKLETHTLLTDHIKLETLMQYSTSTEILAYVCARRSVVRVYL